MNACKCVLRNCKFIFTRGIQTLLELKAAVGIGGGVDGREGEGERERKRDRERQSP